MAPVIIAKGLHKAYAGFSPVLRGVDIEVQAGELVAIMGPSGCGKSTMLHILGLLHMPDSGTLEILGTDIFALDREQTAAFRRGNMGFVMQSSNLFEHSTVFENVEFPLIYEGVPPQERWERVIRALDLVRLSARVHYRSNRLSGGEQQRAAIARAMVNNPRILLADEPTGALDARTSGLIMENFRTLCHTGGVSLVMVTHDPKMAEYCDSIYTLEEGILVNQRRNVPSLPEQSAKSLLDPPAPILRGAMVAEAFPEPSGQRQMEDARLLHLAGLLSRIYALRGSGMLGNPEGYALPLAVRRMGMWHCFSLCRELLRHLRGSPHTLWDLWRLLPLRRRLGLDVFRHLWAFACGALLARWALEENIRFFYATGADSEATVGWVASRLLGVPFAFAVRACDMGRFGRDWPFKIAQAAFVRCDTKTTLEALRGMLPETLGEKLVLLRDPPTLIPPEEPLPAPDTKESGQPLQILAVGTVSAGKGFDVLLHALAKLREKRVPFALKIVGHGPALMGLRWLAWRLGLRRFVSFTGQLPHENMLERYVNADVFVAPVRRTGKDGSDGIPSALIEAMTFALPVIVSDLPSLREIVEHEKSGLVVPQENAAALAEALASLASDPRMRLRLGRGAQSAVNGLKEEQADEERLKDLFMQAVKNSEKI